MATCPPLTRVEEITIGICCASLLSSTIWPYPVGAVTSARASAWMSNVARLFLDAIDGKGSTDKAQRERVRLAGDAADLDILTGLLAYDTSGLGDVLDHVHAIRTRMLALLPVLSSSIAIVAKLNLPRSEVKASVNGTIASMDLRPGEYVPAGHGVMALLDKDSIGGV